MKGLVPVFGSLCVVSLVAAPSSRDVQPVGVQAQPIEVQTSLKERSSCASDDKNAYTEVARVAVKYINRSNAALAIRMGVPFVTRIVVAKDEEALKKESFDYEVSAAEMVYVADPGRGLPKTETVIQSGESATGEVIGYATVRRRELPALKVFLGAGDHVMQLDFTLTFAEMDRAKRVGKEKSVGLQTTPFPFVIGTTPSPVGPCPF